MKINLWWIAGGVIALVLFKKGGSMPDVYGAAVNARAQGTENFTTPAEGTIDSAAAIQKQLEAAQAPTKAALDRTLAGVTGGADRAGLNNEINFLTTTLQNIKTSFLAGKI
jgi:hypothetical protein